MDYNELYRNYNRKTYATIIRILKNEGDAEDANQKLWIKLYYKLNQFKGEAKIGTYLYRCATNEAIMELRKKYAYNKKVNEDVTLDDIENTIGLTDKEIDNDILHEQQLNILTKEIDRLPFNQRITIGMRRMGMSLDQIAKELNVRIGTVKSNLYKGTHSLVNRTERLRA